MKNTDTMGSWLYFKTLQKTVQKHKDIYFPKVI